MDDRSMVMHSMTTTITITQEGRLWQLQKIPTLAHKVYSISLNLNTYYVDLPMTQKLKYDQINNFSTICKQAYHCDNSPRIRQPTEEKLSLYIFWNFELLYTDWILNLLEAIT